MSFHVASAGKPAKVLMELVRERDCFRLSGRSLISIKLVTEGQQIWPRHQSGCGSGTVPSDNLLSEHDAFTLRQDPVRPHARPARRDFPSTPGIASAAPEPPPA